MSTPVSFEKEVPMKKKLDLVQIAAAIAVIAALLWFFLPAKTFDELVPLSGEVSVTAKYWLTRNDCIGQKWEAGSPQAEDILKDLRSVTYSKSPVYYLTYRLRRVGNTLVGNTGTLMIEFRDADGHKHLVGVQYGQFGFNPYGGSLSKGWMASNPELGDKLIEPVIIAPEN